MPRAIRIHLLSTAAILVLGVGLTHAVCPLGDIDGDCDVDALDLRAFAAPICPAVRFDC